MDCPRHPLLVFRTAQLLRLSAVGEEAAFGLCFIQANPAFQWEKSFVSIIIQQEPDMLQQLFVPKCPAGLPAITLHGFAGTSDEQ